jgi:2-dehydropantoate 2-reductase
MRYIIIGAGAVGGTMGGRLFERGHEVVLVARGDHGQALRDRGLRLEMPDRTLRLPIPVVAGPDALTAREDDVLVLAVKTQDTPTALASWESYGERPAVVCAQNGVENERLALRRFRDVHAMCVWLPSSYLEPGVVQAPCAPFTGMLHLGRYPSGSDGKTRRIAADLADSGFVAPVTDEVMAWKYAKLLANLGNGIEAVWGPIEGPARDLGRRAVAEGQAVLDAAGIAYIGEEERARTRAGKLDVRPVGDSLLGGSSSWQSLVRGTGSIESDYLNGEIVLLGRQAGVPTPVNEAIARTANLFARERRRPGSLTDAERSALLSA